MKVNVTIEIEQADKDVIDAIVVAGKDILSKKTSQLLADEILILPKILGELSELKESLSAKNAYASLAYLIYQLGN